MGTVVGVALIAVITLLPLGILLVAAAGARRHGELALRKGDPREVDPDHWTL